MQVRFRRLEGIIFLVTLLLYSVVAGKATVEEAGLLYSPIANDEWCRQKCQSHSECLELFGDNHVDLKLRVADFPDLLRPGENLMNGIFLGDTISNQNFESQFTLDLAFALSISPCKVYVVSASPERRRTAKPWGRTNVIVQFRIIPAETESIRSLSKQVQDPSSTLYSGQVTDKVDPLFGVTVSNWDFSLKLMYSMNVIGANDMEYVDNKPVLNQGSKRWCEEKGNEESQYCEFEMYFRQDVSHSLSIATNQVDVLFIKPSGKDSAFVSFRLIPLTEKSNSSETLIWLGHKHSQLIEQVNNISSMLYQGNVTYRIDPTWGVSGQAGALRSDSKHLRRPMRESNMTMYERCRATHRCPNGRNIYLQNLAYSRPTTSTFLNGEKEIIPLFSDFEDWREGTFGWEQDCDKSDHRDHQCGMQQSRRKGNLPKPMGSHWSPFQYPSQGPSIPSFKDSINSGLVLNKVKLHEDIEKQQVLVDELDSALSWFNNEAKTYSLDTSLRSRKDIFERLQLLEAKYEKILSEEKKKLSALMASQCQHLPCRLHFDTNSLLLQGVINASGEVATSPDGTETAIWCFDSIDLGPEVTVTITGQRSMALLSKSSTYIDTMLEVVPGTLGGFPGSLSPFLPKGNRLWDESNNNINGPGSSSVRVYLFVIETVAPVVHEVQKIIIDADRGQTLAGGFKLHFNNYSSPFLSHNIGAKSLRRVLEDCMNAAKLNTLSQIDRRGVIPGIGKVEVSRKNYGSSGGFEWKITFLTAIGNIGDVDSGPFEVTNLLTGIGAKITVSTLTEGNSIGGTFSIGMLGYETSMLPHDITATRMESILCNDIPTIENAHVTRTDPLGNCNDGFCDNGPHQAGGYTWTVTATTRTGNVSPGSPTSPLFRNEGKVSQIHLNNNLTGCVDLICPTVLVYPGHSRSSIQSMRRFTSLKPFSLSYGASGGSYGGEGGPGSDGITDKVYGDQFLSNIYGGSGGSLGVNQPYEMYFAPNLTQIRGGSGGGAIEVVAINDIVLGPNSNISCDGESGRGGFMKAGGGGSGGAVLIAAGGIIQINGTISVAGGSGGLIAKSNKHGGGGGGGGRIAIFGKSISIKDTESKLNIKGGLGGSCKVSRSCDGQDGSYYLKKHLWQQFHLAQEGAHGTQRSLYMKPFGNTLELLENCKERNRLGWPQFTFEQPETPGRITFNVMFRSGTKEEKRGIWQGLLIDFLSSPMDNVTDQSSTMIRFSIGNAMKRGTGIHDGSCSIEQVQNATTFYSGTVFHHWYKVDIRMNWTSSSFDIYVDDEIAEGNVPLILSAIESIVITNPSIENIHTWVDEIYVGKDTSMGFECPSYDIPKENHLTRRGWNAIKLNDTRTYHDMTRHESHISRRPTHLRSDIGAVQPFDGDTHRLYNLDVKDISPKYVKYGYEDGRFVKSRQNEHGTKGKKGDLFIWYTNHKDEHGNGGIAACSTSDFLTWRNEGLMLDNSNLTDMVNWVTVPLRAENPNVLFNLKTRMYVMWLIVESESREPNLSLSGVAVSSYANGPFTFIRSFYPDGNETREQALVEHDDGHAYLIRSYYATAELVLPRSVMHPIWESVKNMDGSTNFALTYHRAYYEEGYDNYHDIYIQRWRNEDKKLKIICINLHSKEERDISEFESSRWTCNIPFEYMKVIGEGTLHDDLPDGIRSRFLDPESTLNNFWRPASVPGVKAQPWRSNYQDGNCGMEKKDHDMQSYDPNVSLKLSNNHSACSNIVDNPIHPTQPDKKQGVLEVVERRKAKYIEVSRLTDDFLDTTGILYSFEGELENGMDLTALVHKATSMTRNFEKEKPRPTSQTWKKNDHEAFVQSADWDTQFHQYEKKFNDRAFYSTACVMDKKCPVIDYN